MAYPRSSCSTLWTVALLRCVRHKPLRHFDAGLRRLDVPIVPGFVVDDYPGIVRHFGGYFIPEYYSFAEADDELQTVYDVITEVAYQNHSEHWL